MKKINVSFASALVFAFVLVILSSCNGKKEIDEFAQVVVEDLREAYSTEVDDWANKYAEGDSTMCGYFVYDVNGDGIPELWVTGGTCEADRELGVYNYDFAINQIYEGSASHSNFYEGDSCIIALSINNGEAFETKMTYATDTINVETIYQGALSDEAGFKDPTEPRVTLIPYANKAPISDLLKDVDQEE